MAKVSILLLVILLTSLVAGACNKSPNDTQAGSNIAGSIFKELQLEIPTITCASCWLRVEASAKSVSGVIEVRQDRKSTQRVTIMYDPAQTNPSTIIMSIEKNGDRVIELSQ